MESNFICGKCIKDLIYVRRSWDGLSVSQQCFPDYKYVLLSIVNKLMRGSVVKWKDSEILVQKLHQVCDPG